MDRHDALAAFGFFSGISRERLAEIESFSVIQAYEEDEVVFMGNEPAKNLYGLVSGEITLSILFKEEIVTRDVKWEEYKQTQVEVFEKPVVVENVTAGEIFGWSALVEPARMTATARCAAAGEVLLIPADKLKAMFGRDPELGYLLSSRIGNIIARRLNSRTQKLVDAWCTLFETGRIGAVSI